MENFSDEFPTSYAEDNQFHLKRSRNFFIENEFLADYKFIVDEDGVEIPAHKFIICAASGTLERMINGIELCDGSDSSIVYDISSTDFRHIICYLYTDQFKIESCASAWDILKAANYYELPYMMDRCKDFLLTNINLENFFELFNELRLIYPYKEICHGFIPWVQLEARHFFQSNLVEKFELALLKDVLQLNVINCFEWDLFEGTMKWAESKCIQNSLPITVKNMRKVLAGADKLIRFTNLPKRKFDQSFNRFLYNLTLDEIKEILPDNPNDQNLRCPVLNKSMLKFASAQLTAEKDLAHLNKRFQHLFGNALQSDVTFYIVQDDVRVPGHKLVIGARCESLRNLIFGVAIDENNSTISVDGISSENFVEILRFLYTEQCEFNGMENAVEIMRKANDYGLVCLENRCKAYLMTIKITLENIMHILPFEEFVRRYFHFGPCAEAFWAKCLHVVQMDGKTFLDKVDYSKLELNFLKSILQMDPIDCSELDLWKVMHRWAEAWCVKSDRIISAENKRELLLGAENLLRLSTLTTNEFDECLTVDEHFLRPKEIVEVRSAIREGKPKSSRRVMLDRKTFVSDRPLPYFKSQLGGWDFRNGFRYELFNDSIVRVKYYRTLYQSLPSAAQKRALILTLAEMFINDKYKSEAALSIIFRIVNYKEKIKKL